MPNSVKQKPAAVKQKLASKAATKEQISQLWEGNDDFVNQVPKVRVQKSDK